MTDESPLPSLISRLMQVILSPIVLFDGLSRRPVWGGAVLLGSLLVFLGVALMPPELALATLRERLVEQGQSMPPGLESRLGMIRIGGAVGASFAWVILMGFFAGVVTVVFAFLLGHEGNFRQYLAVVSHAHLISAASVIVLLPLRIATQDAQVLLSARQLRVFSGRGISASDAESRGSVRALGVGARRPWGEQNRS